MFDFEKGTMVRVTWVDSMASYGWDSVEDKIDKAKSPDQLMCASVGYLLHEDDNGVSLVQSFSAGGQAHSLITIPKASVRSVEKLYLGADAVQQVADRPDKTCLTVCYQGSQRTP